MASRKTEATGDEATLITDAQTNRLIQYTNTPIYPKKSYISLPLESITQTKPSVNIRADLLDVCIDVCSLEVLVLFTENFDYQDMKKDFVKGILESDLLGKTIYSHVFGKILFIL